MKPRFIGASFTFYDNDLRLAVDGKPAAGLAGLASLGVGSAVLWSANIRYT